MLSGAPYIERLLSQERPRVGPFRLLHALGAGGFAPVYLAAEEHGDIELRTVAIKLFAVDGPEDVAAPGTGRTGGRTARDRILEEARALCRVEHPHIVRFLQLTYDETGTVLGLAMEHVQGRSLAGRLDRGPKPTLAETLEIGTAIASALAAVHHAGLVHRDVKPANIVEAHGIYKLIDFGIATWVEPLAAASLRPSAVAMSGQVTGDGMTMPAIDGGSAAVPVAGTPGYMDPVCIGGQAPADASSDLYGLGATLYECLTGRLPASLGPDVSRLVPNVLGGVVAPPNVRALAHETPDEVARLVDTLVAPQRKDRPQRAEWVAVELERLRRVVRGRNRPLPEEGPFRGLGRFEEGDRDVYFARSANVAAGIEVLRTHGLLALVGSSGSGKSSLARAGLLPAIAEGALGSWPSVWRTVTLTPGTDPRGALSAALAMRPLPDDPHALVEALGARVDAEGVGLAILVDQLEEILTQSDDAGRVYLASLIGRLARAPVPGLRGLVTVRRDLLDGVLALPELGPELVRCTELVSPLVPASWVAVLDDGLAAYGYAMEDRAMRAELARELDVTAEAMPLVAFGLSKLWERRDVERRIIPRQALADIGGLAGALEQHAEGALRALVDAHGPGAEACVRAALVALTTPRGTRARRALAELAQAIDDPLLGTVLKKLEEARLVVSEDAQLTLTHEALLVQWQRLRGWVADVREDRQLASELEEAAGGWSGKRETDRLWRGRRLDDGRALASRRTVPLTDAARVFLAASRRVEVRARIALGALMASVVAGSILLVATYLRGEAEARAEKQSAVNVVQQLVAARNTPEGERARAMIDLQKANRACERELLRLKDGADASPEGRSPPAP